MAIVARDQFNRTVSNGWGSAPIGGPYTLWWPSFTDPLPSQYQVLPVDGQIRFPPGIGEYHTYALLDVPVLGVEADAIWRVELPQTGASNVRPVMVLRHSNIPANPNEWYHIEVAPAPSGLLQIDAIRGVGNQLFLLDRATSAEPFVADRYYGLRVRICPEETGGNWYTTIRAQIWNADQDPGPVGWLLTYWIDAGSDDEIGAGIVGLGARGFTSSSATTNGQPAAGIVHFAEWTVRDDCAGVAARPFGWIV